MYNLSMKKTWILLAILILIVIAALVRQHYQLKAVEEEADQLESNNGLPIGTPGNSAPPSTIEACADKELGDQCELGNTKGTCFMSGESLACGPTN